MMGRRQVAGVFVLLLAAGCRQGVDERAGDSPGQRVEGSVSSTPEDADTQMYKRCMALWNNGNPTDFDAYFDCRNEYNAQGGRRNLP